MKKDSISFINLFCAIFTWLLTAAWILLIFALSNESTQESFARSADLASQFSDLLKIQISNQYIRIFAHVFEYAVLTVMSMLSIQFTNQIIIREEIDVVEEEKKIVKTDNEMYILFALWFTVMLALFDEYHKIFVSGRDGTILNVCYDLCGILPVLLFSRISFSIKLIMENKKKKSEKGT